ncbi:MAG TPA: FAD-dependent oxidoreductase [Solirubrobacteraceae bacterium]|nr:FAD-dependent oxidoreductase [Solirubrobacteraceae bacterium]
MTDPDTPHSALRIAVVGSGPAGFYTAGHLLKDSAGRFDVDMFERLPTPWGLVRSGVAPDHPKIKSVTRVYERTAAHPRFRFFGNVTFGQHVSRGDLLEHYHAVVYATGSPSDRSLNIPGEDLPGSHPATEFVGWYNGHPDHSDLEVDLLSAERAVVIGNGNVALDVARMLVLEPSELAGTDTADHALEVLARSNVREVLVIGRRGPAQAAFTNPELLELADLAGADVIVDPRELELALAVHDPAAQEDITARRNVEILREYAAKPPAGRPKRIVLRFLLSPTALHAGPSGHLASVELVRNRLLANPSGGGLRAQATEETHTIETGLLFRAVGYRALPLPEVPFEESSATILNHAGRVLDPQTRAHLPGEYVVGWVKRGPSGVIGTNKKDAQETVDAIFADLSPDSAAPRHEPSAPDPEAIEALLRERQPDLVPYAGWEAIDRHERSLGVPAGRPRVKLTTIEDLLRAAAAETPSRA